ncbi:methyltransferase domain-containing protein [Hymenobacter oligotrophus]|uniref:tRNA1(Val) (adenine(37)-N6)-methyltransferase n=2 Tax=Hymenobacter oligotrophus TaxID=2319843 RepID=A0A3B7R3W9_9BACT|nr:methyltransferase domain-containing protein [Hymenobacter oligotrophus]
MKVCTDACILGASADLGAAHRILDVGTGTGLLALMAAQRNPTARIEAVEIDAAAAAQATLNALASPWAERIGVWAGSLAGFAATQPAPYQLIVCNPPFFRHSLRSPDAARTTARHTAADTLTFAELAAFAAQFLAPDGHLTVLLPPPEMQAFESEAHRAGLYPSSRLVVRHRPGSKALRHITAFGLVAQPCTSHELAIHAAQSNAYSEEFEHLLRDFYLAF